jgi:predicted acyl esterase
VKVIDVYPADYPDSHEEDEAKSNDVPAPHIALGGYQQLLRGEPLRGKFRNSMEKPEPFTPGKVETISFDMPDVFHTFRRGHRIMVQVQSSWFPLIDRNPQTFTDIPYAKPADFQKATEKIYRGGSQASGIVVGVMPAN